MRRRRLAPIERVKELSSAVYGPSAAVSVDASSGGVSVIVWNGAGVEVLRASAPTRKGALYAMVKSLRAVASVTRAQIVMAAAIAGVDPRTVARALDGRTKCQAVRAAIARAFRQIGQHKEAAALEATGGAS